MTALPTGSETMTHLPTPFTLPEYEAWRRAEAIRHKETMDRVNQVMKNHYAPAVESMMNADIPSASFSGLVMQKIRGDS